MQVLKFGGTSVADSVNIGKVISIIKNAIEHDKTIVVASAISGCTDSLALIGNTAAAHDRKYVELIDRLEERHLKLIDELVSNEYKDETFTACSDIIKKLRDIANGVYLVREISNYTIDLIMSFGEILSTKIISAKLNSLNISHKWIDSGTVIRTERHRSQNIVDAKTTNANIKKMLSKNNCKLYVLPGFIASDAQGRTTTLGRGGSDYTASLLAVGSSARILEIWTDVTGMMTADPRIVSDAQTINNISYKEALELSHFGAKVVYPPTIQPVVSKGIPIYVKNTFAPEERGTLIESNPPETHGKIRGISSSNRIALLSMEGNGMVGIPGYSSRLFDTLAKSEINIILITQASSVHTMCVAIDESLADRAKIAVDETFAYEISLGKVEPLKVEKGFSIISLVGNDMKNQSGACGRMFDALGRCGINIRAIAQGSSEKNVSTVVATADVNDAIRTIHYEFFGESGKTINLFVAGYGSVGKQLIEMIRHQKQYMETQRGKQIVIAGLSNSKKYVISKTGINLNDIDNELNNGEDNLSGDDYFDRIFSCSLHNTIFVDCTASKYVSAKYKELFLNGISVVTCNKIACSSDFSNYKTLMEAAKKEKVSFKYEAAVGAALPVISLINQIINSGDRIHACEAVLSGSLNFIFSGYDGKKSFAQTVREAQNAGYTEPDPRLDLSGTDVVRKITILAREAGLNLEQNDVEKKMFLPDEYFKGDMENFYSTVQKNEPYFKKLYDEAKAENKKLRFTASIRNGKARAGLEKIDKTHPFYNLDGTDNAVLLYTDFYLSPLLIQGAGAGAEQTASGILNDILLSF
ncbi:MAG: bifunctional aspartate kinase/homoserine dehydrogenase I [Prevotellaceae bacterium]|jgi:aspartokinase/homoserine dehydrogenase 1|nr:bifunctional aspartate kinase/homoserine dehydrogenase I [Prevotellaceae bacterium]